MHIKHETFSFNDKVWPGNSENIKPNDVVEIYANPYFEVLYLEGKSCFSTSVYCCKRIFLYGLSPENFGYTLV
jgi:hypothetical protein